jgi:hypothetical protein
MKKILLAILFLSCYAPLYAESNNRPDRLGAGLILGAPTGISVKYWVDATHAFDAALRFGDISVHADYLWHRWDKLPKPRQGRLATYWGLGGRVKEEGKDTYFGVRAVGGVAYDLPQHPVDLFLEVVPVLELLPDTRLDIDAALGVRYYFN